MYNDSEYKKALNTCFLYFLTSDNNLLSVSEENNDNENNEITIIKVTDRNLL